ncbi:hypothetical protein [Nostoc sp. 'Peltigera membranacea cyanobiont' N6]|uniref:hypothetical protein n=1 Tax=Nostoc sp. 'Peltigera membranacea cyanobiont' N6 TaxID=1261031 RepID=UPI000CF32197|nr:hypothetical protein [Nostoc sp. 'Peltigera membranacea cyanobiont' N6]AVH67113.1 hypothetical protein NPM_5686 [Nostoc sp. 'Peltigera membranacea cyanobiont' N6]
MKLTNLINSALIFASINLVPGIAVAQVATNNSSETIAINSNNLPSNSTYVNYFQPFNLVTFAYQGGLKQHGIPSGETLVFETQNRNIIAKDLVKAAVNADKLPSQLLNDQNYLSAVNLQLNALPDYAAAD